MKDNLEKYVDGHCHFTMDNIESNLEKAEQSISHLMAIIDIADDDFALMIQKLRSYNKIKIFIALGCHPNSVEKIDFELMKSRYNQYIDQIDCIGEIGLDFFKSNNVEQQKKYLEYQCKLAKKNNKPINIHARGCAMDDIIPIIGQNKHITIHCCTFGWEEVQKALNIGAYISYSGIVTFKKKVEYIQESMENTPLNRLIIETDSPFLAPTPNRGKTNECSFIKHTYQFISESKNIKIDQLRTQVKKNFLLSMNQ